MKDVEQQSQLTTSQNRQTVRLTFQYDGERVELASQQRLEKVAPATVGPMPVLGENSGFWLEVRDSEERVLYYRALYNPIQYSVEVKTPDGQFRRVHGAPGQGIFDVQVPDLPNASSVVLISSPLNFEESLKPAQEIGRFPLRADSTN